MPIWARMTLTGVFGVAAPRHCGPADLELPCQSGPSSGNDICSMPIRPRRTADPSEALALARRDGACILTHLDTTTAASVGAMSQAVFGAEASGIQAPVHVGTNNFGFRGGEKITNADRRPAHVDSILVCTTEYAQAIPATHD